MQQSLEQAGTRWRDAFAPVVAGVVEDAADHWRVEAGIAFDVANLQAQAWFIDYMLVFSTPITDTSEREIAALLQQGMREGWSTSKMQGAITQLFQQWVDGDVDAADFSGERLPPWRTEAIARTETMRAYAVGSMEIYRGAGVTQKEWLATTDDRTRDSHTAADGQVVAINAPFIVGGYEMDCPGDPKAPPSETINCRCTVLPVIPDDVGEATTLQPLGTPVSTALTLPDSGAIVPQLQSALNAIDRVHGDGELPSIPITLTADTDYRGRFTIRPKTGDQPRTANEINISLFGDRPALTLAHEIGHFLDHAAMGENLEALSARAALSNNHPLNVWMNAVTNSPEYVLIREMRSNPSKYQRTVDYNGQQVTITPNTRQMGNYLLNQELWARSYAQYIAEESQDADLLASIQAIRETEMYGVAQWSEENFKPIRDTITEFFKLKGWVK